MANTDRVFTGDQTSTFLGWADGFAANTGTAACIGHNHAISASSIGDDTIRRSPSTPKIAPPLRHTKQCALVQAGLIIARDETSALLAYVDGFATNTRAASRIGHSHTIGARSIYRNAIRGRSRAPQITGCVCCGTKFSALSGTDRIIARDRAKRLLACRDGFATNTRASSRIGHSHTIGARSVDGDAIRSRSGTPQITHLASWNTKLGALACANRVIARDQASALLAVDDGFATNTDATISISDGHAIGARSVYSDAIRGRSGTPQITHRTCWNTKLRALSGTDGVIARDQAGRLLADGNYFATNTGAASRIRHSHTIDARSVDGDAIRGRSCAPQITHRARFNTKLSALSGANRVYTGDEATWQKVDNHCSATNTLTTSPIRYRDGIGASNTCGDTIGRSTCTPQIASISSGYTKIRA